MVLRVLALIAARAGSRGLTDKNLRKVGGVPLLVRAITLAAQSRRPAEHWQVVVSTDSRRYAELAARAGAEIPFLRPRRLATARARLIDVVLHTVETLSRKGAQFDAVLLVSATTPLTTVADVRRALRLFRRRRRAVVSVVPDPIPDSWRFRARRGLLFGLGGSGRVTRRQEAATRYRLNGALFVASPTWLVRHHQFFVSGETAALVMPVERSLDIESPFDLALADFLISRNSKRKSRLV